MKKVLSAVVACLGLIGTAPVFGADTKIRIGYQTLWSPIAEIASVMRHTDVLKKNGLEGSFTAFTYAGPMAEAIGAGLLDTAYGGWMPALTFMKAGPDWKLTSQIIEYGWYIVVTEPDKIKRISDLKGKKLAVPYGALVQFLAVRAFRNVGIDGHVTLVNVDAGGLAGSMKAGAVDGIIAWHPLQANVLRLGLGKLLPLGSQDTVVGVQTISGDFIKRHEDAAVGFLKALTMAFEYASKNRDQVIGWYLSDHPQVKLPRELIAQAWDVDRYLKQPTDLRTIDLRLTEQDLSFGQEIADLANELGFLPRKVDVRKLADKRLMERALRELRK